MSRALPFSHNPKLPAEQAALGGLTRRGLLQGAGITTAALLLAACSSSAVAKPTPAADKSDTQKSLRFDSRETYRNIGTAENYPLLDEFQSATGIDVTYSNAVTDDSTYYSKVRKQLALGHDIGADAVVLSDWMVTKLIRLGYLQEFDHDRIPNLANVRPELNSATFDPGRVFSMPWRSGFTGLAWNVDALPDGLSSVSDLWDPALSGRVSVMAGMRDTIGSIMLDLGTDVSQSWGDDEFSAAVELLKEQVGGGQLRSIKGNAYREDLKSGATVAAIARSGDIMQINQEAGDHWAFAIPEHGGLLWSDEVVIPIGSTHKRNAEDFVNFYYEADNAARVAVATSFISPVSITQPPTTDEHGELIAANTMVFPDDATFSSARAFRTLSVSEEQRFGAQYQAVLLGAA